MHRVSFPIQMTSENSKLEKLIQIQSKITSCRACSNMVGPPVHGAAVNTPIFLLGQAPGPHEAKYGRPFAYTAGRTLFRWFNEAAGVDETEFRKHVYMAAVARCFPGKGTGGGDRVPNTQEIINCATHLKREIEFLKPKLMIAVGKLAISQVLGPEVFGSGALLTAVVGKKFVSKFQGHTMDVICVPHPSGLSSWPKVEPGKTLLKEALQLIVEHPTWQDVFKNRPKSKALLQQPRTSES